MASPMPARLSSMSRPGVLAAGGSRDDETTYRCFYLRLRLRPLFDAHHAGVGGRLGGHLSSSTGAPILAGRVADRGFVRHPDLRGAGSGGPVPPAPLRGDGHRDAQGPKVVAACRSRLGGGFTYRLAPGLAHGRGGLPHPVAALDPRVFPRPRSRARKSARRRSTSSCVSPSPGVVLDPPSRAPKRSSLSSPTGVAMRRSIKR